ncbi:MAG: cpaC [Caulobacteraceae bacterium]|nr:cpaC [Caulobacteraceae bacterium]
MRGFLSHLRLLALTVAFGLGVAAPATAPAQSLQSEAAVNTVINVPKDKSLSFRLDTPAAKIVVAQPEIAEIVATTDRSFYVRGVEFGSTNLLVYGPGGRLMQVIDDRVGFAADSLQQDLHAALPDELISVTNLGEGLLLTGDVSNTGAAARARVIADRYAPGAITSSLSVRAAQQVVLEVRVIEASRSALQDIGVGLSVGNSSFQVTSAGGLVGSSPASTAISIFGGIGQANVDVTIQALEQKGIVRTLARPNLVAVSGEKASFLAGGEFPFPVPDGDRGLTVQFREYGVKLNFQPVVQSNGLIKMLVEPEVSQLDPTSSLRFNGFEVPGLITRKASTTVELKSGDSFAIAGLFQRDMTNTANQIPLLGNVPVIGALFRSARFRRAETELMIIVTPRLATAADFAAVNGEGKLPKEPTALGMFLGSQVLDRPMAHEGEPVGAK